MLAEEAYFKHPVIREINEHCFSRSKRSREMSRMIPDVKVLLKDNIYEFVEKFKIDIIVPQNALAIPVNIPLGLAITEFIAETGIITLAHHHDFFW